MAHTVLSVVAEVQPDSADLLKRRIAALRMAEEGNDFSRAEAIDTLHFMSISVFDDPHFDPVLVFENNFDGDAASHWRKLQQAFGDELRGILACCKDALSSEYEPLFRPGSTLSLAGFLDAHAVPPSAYHIGNPGMTVDRIRRERALMLRVRERLDGAIVEFRSRRPTEIHAALRQELLPQFSWLGHEEGRVSQAERLRYWAEALLSFVLPVLFVWIGIPVLLSVFYRLHWTAAVAIIVLLPVLLIVSLRRLEDSDPVEQRPDPNTATMARIAARENQIAQNHLASMVLVKPGVTRGILIRLGVGALKHYARLFATDGYLGPMRTIHFAHWALVGNGSRLLFLSNYDGSWESYLDDFVDKAHTGLTLAWSNCIGFPPTRWLVKDGATHGLLFKAWARQSQRESIFWYSAYNDLTVNQIEHNYAIAEGLRKPTLSEEEAGAWAQLL